MPSPDWKNFIWKRISEVFLSSELILDFEEIPNFFPSKNCDKNFLIVLEAIKTNKFILERLFENQCYNKKGIYYIKVFYNF